MFKIFHKHIMLLVEYIMYVFTRIFIFMCNTTKTELINTELINRKIIQVDIKVSYGTIIIMLINGMPM